MKKIIIFLMLAIMIFCVGCKSTKTMIKNKKDFLDYYTVKSEIEYFDFKSIDSKATVYKDIEKDCIESGVVKLTTGDNIFYIRNNSSFKKITIHKNTYTNIYITTLFGEMFYYKLDEDETMEFPKNIKYKIDTELSQVTSPLISKIDSKIFIDGCIENFNNTFNKIFEHRTDDYVCDLGSCIHYNNRVLSQEKEINDGIKFGIQCKVLYQTSGQTCLSFYPYIDTNNFVPKIREEKGYACHILIMEKQYYTYRFKVDNTVYEYPVTIDYNSQWGEKNSWFGEKNACFALDDDEYSLYEIGDVLFSPIIVSNSSLINLSIETKDIVKKDSLFTDFSITQNFNN